MDPLSLDESVVPSLTPLPGGHSGETFLAEAAGERTVVRIYAGRGASRAPNAAEIDAAVLRLLRGLVPVPDVLEVRRADPAAGTPALLVTSYLPGERLDEVLPTADAELATAIGHNVGGILARLAQMPLLRAGEFLDGELRVGPMPPAADDLVAWVDAHRGRLTGWTAEDLRGLDDLAARAQDLLDETTRTCLVHSDFNAKNLLVDPGTGAVTGVLDWEFSHAGGPFTDLGNMLRFDRRADLADSVVSTYLDRVVDAPEDLPDRARAADLFALVDLASRRGENPVTESANDLLLRCARTGDLHAWS